MGNTPLADGCDCGSANTPVGHSPWPPFPVLDRGRSCAAKGATVGTYTFDANGNMTVEQVAGSGLLNSFVYDQENRLLNEIRASGARHTYTYEPDGLRRTAFHAGTASVVTFIWDGDDLLNERIEGANAARYAVLDGEVLSEKRGASRHRFVPDPLGSVRAVLDTSGSIVATRDYWPYGEVAAESGGMTSLQFVGALGYFTGAVNRICLPARYYRPDLGRWQTRDPIGFAGGDWNLYAYARNSPCLLTDPSGRSIFVCTVFFSNGLLSHQFISTNRCGSFGFYGFTGGNPCAGRCEIDDLHLLCPKPPQYVWVIECTAALGCVRVKRKVCMPGVGANPNVRCEQVGGDNDERERALCECMRQSCSRPPFYVLPGFCCTNWVAEMLDCSWAALAMPAETGQLVIT